MKGANDRLVVILGYCDKDVLRSASSKAVDDMHYTLWPVLDVKFKSALRSGSSFVQRPHKDVSSFLLLQQELTWRHKTLTSQRRDCTVRVGIVPPITVGIAI